MIEALFANQGEVFGFKPRAPGGFSRAVQRVSEVDTTAESCVDLTRRGHGDVGYIVVRWLEWYGLTNVASALVFLDRRGGIDWCDIGCTTGICGC